MKTRLLLSFSMIIALSILLNNTDIAYSAAGNSPDQLVSSQKKPGKLTDQLFNFFGIINNDEISSDLIIVENKVVDSEPSIQMMGTSTSTKVIVAQVPTITQTPIPTLTATPEPTFTPTYDPTAIFTFEPTTIPIKVVIASADANSTIETFAAEVRAQGMNGLWAEGKFAYRFYSASWGSVPESANTTSLASFDGYKSFFIHNYLGGNKLYNVGSGTKVAVIWSDRIDWYTISGVNQVAGTNMGNCSYSEPFSSWNGEGSFSAREILDIYYNSPFVIQTCICSGDKAGFLILSGY